ncbi:IMPACT family protein [Mycolicibacterium mengxianglii]|uniref:IMPACT family protein n=1 Tax=Mycolicibacterium mengxianglii TaxID=2736649 RepID=UPI0018D00E26|nr:YigZ family protein [Mycolicibacterium mengxianglii]
MPFTLDPEAEPRSEALIKKSRFIARLRHVGSEDAATEFITVVREADRGANHHCFAYIISDDETRIERHSDDGEPTGTAGSPILNALESHDLVNVVAVVSRYFGGVRLGTGGLARAYSGTVVSAVEGADLRPWLRWQVYRLTAHHAEAGWLESELRGRGFEVTGVSYAESAVITVICVDATRLRSALAEMTSGRAELVYAGEVWR